MEGLFNFLASRNGRIVRAVAGIVLIVIGLIVVFGNDSTGGWILVVIGLVPLAAGVFDFCLFAPLFGLSFKGEELRARGEEPPSGGE